MASVVPYYDLHIVLHNLLLLRLETMVLGHISYSISAFASVFLGFFGSGYLGAVVACCSFVGLLRALGLLGFSGFWAAADELERPLRINKIQKNN